MMVQLKTQVWNMNIMQIYAPIVEKAENVV